MKKNKLDGFSVEDYANNEATRRSVSDYIFFYFVIVLFHGNLKFKEMLLFLLLKLNLLV